VEAALPVPVAAEWAQEGMEAGNRSCRGRNYFNAIGWSQAPSPAESHTANRTHFLPVASKGILKVFVPKGVRSVRLKELTVDVGAVAPNQLCEVEGKGYSMVAL
jgi:hypothetical protein